jgi:hypothetical protein
VCRPIDRWKKAGGFAPPDLSAWPTFPEKFSDLITFSGTFVAGAGQA